MRVRASSLRLRPSPRPAAAGHAVRCAWRRQVLKRCEREAQLVASQQTSLVCARLRCSVTTRSRRRNRLWPSGLQYNCQAHANCMTQHVTVHWHSSWALLFHLQEATHKNAQRKLTNARCPDHAFCRTRSAHAGAGMVFNVQRSQEFIFCLAENHFHDESSLGLSLDLACHL